MIASQMGDTRYRGKLVWMLLTSRPDLLPIDLKRQGRAEVHLPLFSPRTEDEITFMIRAMARKNRTSLADDALPDHLAGRGLSGADIESIVLAAKRRALSRGREAIAREDLAGGRRGLHPVRPGAGEGEAGAGGRAGMHVDVVPARGVADARRRARRPRPAAGADGRHPPIARGMRTVSIAVTTFPVEAHTMSKTKAAGSGTRTDWLDDTTETPLIGQYAERLGTFLEAMADGRIEPEELQAQEARVAALMKSDRAEARRRAPRGSDPAPLRAVGVQHHAYDAPVDGSGAADEVPGMMNIPSFVVVVGALPMRFDH